MSTRFRRAQRTSSLGLGLVQTHIARWESFNRSIPSGTLATPEPTAGMLVALPSTTTIVASTRRRRVQRIVQAKESAISLT